MTFGRVLGDARGPLPVSQGGTGASSEQAARDNLKVPGLETGNNFVGDQNINGSLTVSDELLEVTGTTGIRAQRLITVDGAYTCTYADPDYTALTADRHIEPPDASGTIIVSADATAKGTILYHDGSVWKLLSPSAGVLTCDGSGNLSWA